jgi:hypothetical protein
MYSSVTAGLGVLAGFGGGGNCFFAANDNADTNAINITTSKERIDWERGISLL